MDLVKMSTLRQVTQTWVFSLIKIFWEVGRGCLWGGTYCRVGILWGDEVAELFGEYIVVIPTASSYILNISLLVPRMDWLIFFLSNAFSVPCKTDIYLCLFGLVIVNVDIQYISMIKSSSPIGLEIPLIPGVIVGSDSPQCVLESKSSGNHIHRANISFSYDSHGHFIGWEFWCFEGFVLHNSVVS